MVVTAFSLQMIPIIFHREASDHFNPHQQPRAHQSEQLCLLQCDATGVSMALLSKSRVLLNLEVYSLGLTALDWGGVRLPSLALFGWQNWMNMRGWLAR